MQAVSSIMSGVPGIESILELFEEHHHSVLQSAYRITGRAEDAEDVLQTVFMRLLQNPALVNGLGGGARFYLQRAAVNAALDVVRSRKASERIPLDVLQPYLADSAAMPDRLRQSRELAAWLRRSLAGVHPTAAEMFALRYIEGFSNQEIAEAMGTTAGTVAVSLHRTRARLQQEMAGKF